MFTDPTTQRLWHAGQIRAAYEASAKITAPRVTADHPFRDAVSLLDTARQWHEHGMLCWHAARFAEAGAVLGRAHAARREALGEDHPDTLDTLERLAALAHYLIADDAPAKFEDVMARLARVLGEDHVRVAIARRNYAACLRDRSRLAEARVALDAATETIERALPPEHPDVIAALKVDGMLHLAEKSYHAAIGRAERAMELATRVWSEEHPFVASAELIVARGEDRLGDSKKASKRLPGIIKRLERAYGEHPMVALALGKQAEVELALGMNFQRAEELARAAIAMYRKTYATVGAMTLTLFNILFTSGQVVEAGELLLEAGKDLSEAWRLNLAGRLANHFARLRDYPSALPWAERVRDLCTDPKARAQWAETAERCAAHVRR